MRNINSMSREECLGLKQAQLSTHTVRTYRQRSCNQIVVCNIKFHDLKASLLNNVALFVYYIDVRCYMNRWGVTVLELNCHPENNKGPDYAPCACT